MALNQLAQELDHACSNEGLAETLSKLPAGNFGWQLSVLCRLRSAAFARVLPGEIVWNSLLDEKWRNSVLLTLPEHPLAIFFESLEEIQAANGGKWLSHLPHFLAQACESDECNDERRLRLFDYTIINSLHTDSSSAIQRLFSGRFRHPFMQHAQHWHKRLSDAQRGLPSWVASRVGALLSALH